MQRAILICVAIVVLMALAASFAMRRGGAERRSGGRASVNAHSVDPVDCGAMWARGVELKGVVGGRESQAYFDMAPVIGAPKQVSGVVVFPGERKREALADTAIGLEGPLNDDHCGVQLKKLDGDTDGSVWQLRIESVALVRGTRQMPERNPEAIVFNVVPETPCDGAGEWRTFSSPHWLITFDYPANWVLLDDQDDVNIECPSVTRLAAGGAWLTFERGRLAPRGAGPTTPSDSSFTEPYWFVRRTAGLSPRAQAGDDWRVNDFGCAERDKRDVPADGCYPARRSERSGLTVLQGAAGEHRVFRPGVGYLGLGAGITRYLVVLGDQWMSLDSNDASDHYGDIGKNGGPVLLDGDAVGERVVRSIKPR